MLVPHRIIRESEIHDSSFRQNEDQQCEIVLHAALTIFPLVLKNSTDGF